MMSRAPRFGYVVAIGIIGLALLVVRLGGYSAYVVTSGSMEPGIAMGSLVVVEPVPPESVRPGDVITYALSDRVVTHRVQAVMWSDGALALATRGDANTALDPWLVHPDSEVGVVRATIPLIGFAIIDVQRWWRLVAVVLLFSLALEALLTRVRGRRRSIVPQRASG
jgi:signal peptidase